MYRINLFPEQTQKRRFAKRNLALLSITVSIAVVQLALVATMGITVRLTADESRRIEEEIEELSKDLATYRSSPDSTAGIDLLQIRGRRVEWSPKLAVLQDLDPRLLLTGVEGRAAKGEQISSLTLTGVRTDSGTDFSPVSGLLDQLRSERSVAQDFRTVTLDRLEDETASRFTIVCRGSVEVN